MEAWQEKRSIQTMNLRSVFTPEQQRILERYYDNGMTNQSKSCFQLILQCAQETKLDFSVVRTWVGNKRRKLASKVDQNGQRHSDLPHSLANHALAGGVGGAGPLGVGAVLSAELAAAARGGVQRGPSVAHLLPPTSCPSSSSSPSSCSPHSSGGGSGGGGSSSSSNNNNNNNDVIVTGIYSIGRASGLASSRVDGSSSLGRSAAASKTLASSSTTSSSSSSHPLETDTHSSQARMLPVRTDPAALHSRVSVALPHGKSPQMQPQQQQPSPSSSLLYSQARKSFLPRDPAVAAVAAGIPRSWAKQYGTSQPQPWALGASQSSQIHSLPSAPAPPAHLTPPRSSADASVRIQQVFTLAGLAEAQQRLAMGVVSGGGGGGGGGRASGSAGPSQEARPARRPPRPPDPPETFSIAMETADADDEYSREEELASMGAQMQIGRERNSSSSSASEGGSVGGGGGVAGTSSWMDGRGGGRGSPSVSSRTQVSVALNSPGSDLFGEKGCQTQSSYLAGSGAWGGFPLRLLSQGSPLGMANLKQIPGNVAAPWLISNSRKRTLQDRTQFSDKDLHSLKRYWDNGMTSLGSVCREKISAASTELSVDSEIIKTWIGNRRRKYRLMGIEIPPPKGGPPTFPKQSSTDPPSPLTPEGPEPKTPEAGEGSEHNDEVSVCLSEDGASDAYQRESDVGQEDMSLGGQAENVKIEIIDDDEDDDDGDIMTSDMEQMHSLLEFKHEEVQYLENELENQKQRYFELKSFTRSLLSAVKNDDKEKQQELLASLPQLTDDDWEKSPEREEEPSIEEDMTTTTTTTTAVTSVAPPESSVSEEEGGTEEHL